MVVLQRVVLKPIKPSFLLIRKQIKYYGFVAYTNFICSFGGNLVSWLTYYVGPLGVISHQNQTFATSENTGTLLLCTVVAELFIH